MDGSTSVGMKRICVYTHLFPARSETFIREHVSGLAREGHRVTVLARESGDGIAAAELAAIDALGVERAYLGSFTWFSTKLTRALNGLHALLLVLRHPRLFRIFRRPAPWTIHQLLIATEAARFIDGGRFDVVHVHFGHLGACLRLVASAFDRFPPMLVTWHGYDINVKPKQLGAPAYRKLFESQAVHTVGSDFIRKKLVQLGAHVDRTRKIPMGVDIERFSFVTRRREAGAPFRLLSVGRLEEVKGHAYLIDAVARLRGANLPVSLKIAGDGPLREALRAQIEALDLGEHVKLLGAVDSAQVVKEMHEAHLFALAGVETSSGKVESQGVVFAEAQATGLPVVASRLGGIPESLVEGETGMLCAPRSVDEIVAAVRFFVETPTAAAAFGQRGREFVERFFSREKMLADFSDLYSRLTP